MPIRIGSMLTKLGRRNHQVRENSVAYGGFDYNNTGLARRIDESALRD